jgi:hypothetical protein
MFVALSYPSRNAHEPYCHLRPDRLYNIFPHYLTNRKVAGSIPDGDFGIFHWNNPSDRTMALGVDSASNRNEYQEHFLGVKAAGA